MRDLTPEELDMIYPAECHFKVIARTGKAQSRIENALEKHGVKAPVRLGNTSRTGNYLTFNVTVWVNNRETMQSLDASLRRIEGVVTVL